MHVHTCEKWKKSAGVVGGPLLVGRSGALTSPPKIRPCCGAERVKKSNKRSRAVSAERGSKNQVERERSGSGTPLNGAERWAGNYAALLTCFVDVCYAAVASALIRQTRQQYVICYRCQRQRLMFRCLLHGCLDINWPTYANVHGHKMSRIPNIVNLSLIF